VELQDQAGACLATALLDPRDRIVARVLAPGRVDLNEIWIAKKVESALALRREYGDFEEDSACRLINAEGDGLPGVTVERYGRHLMIQWYTEAWKPHKGLLLKVLQDRLAPTGIYEKFRPRQTRALAAEGEDRKYSRLVNGTPRSGRFAVRENGLSYLIDLEEGLNTGLFLDQRANRRYLRERSAGRSFLNLFAYTGSFSVAAAAGGASGTTSVDASGSYLEWAEENFAANDLDPSAHEFIEGDCFAVLDDLRRAQRRFDIVLMDPPSFSTTRQSTFTTRGGTSELVAAALELLPSGGLLAVSSNHQKTDLADYLKEIRRGSLKAGCEARVISVMGQPVDFPYSITFPEGRYLKFVLAVKI